MEDDPMPFFQVRDLSLFPFDKQDVEPQEAEKNPTCCRVLAGAFFLVWNLRKRSLIETVNDQLKNISQIEHTRQRSPQNFLVNLLPGIAAYGRQAKKPSLNLGGRGSLLSPS